MYFAQTSAKRRLLLHFLNGGLLLALSVTWAILWEKLPNPFPIHFGLNGEPDRFTEPGAEVFIVLVLLPWLMTALLYATRLLIRFSIKHPAIMNLPNKEQFLQLPQQQQESLLLIMFEFSIALAFTLNLVFVCAGIGSLLVAFQILQRLPVMILVSLILLSIGIVVIYLIAFSKAISRLAQEKTE